MSGRSQSFPSQSFSVARHAQHLGRAPADIDYGACNFLISLMRMVFHSGSRARWVRGEAEHRREENSCRLALLVAGALAIALAFGGAFVPSGLGWWQTIVFALALLGTSHPARAVLTGKFSDTSWFGKFLAGTSGKDEERRYAGNAKNISENMKPGKPDCHPAFPKAIA